MHPKLLLDVIRRQSGSLHKSVLEGVQNSIEAGATKIEVFLSPTELRIVDDGIGFTRSQIENCFEVFGAPHTEEERATKVYAQFRMGRGQLFSFGVNRWRTGTFQMDVDIEKFVSEGGDLAAMESGDIGYELTEGLPELAGCSIQIKLYEELRSDLLSFCIRDIERYVKYCSVPVIVNGRQVSVNPSSLKWDFDTEEGYIKLTGSDRGVAIYNMGVFVTSDYRLGVSGTVVSKKRLEVNFARNEIIGTCPVWKNLRKLVKANTEKGIMRKKKLDDAERVHVISGLLSGELSGKDISHCGLLPDVTGRYWSAKEILRRSDPFWSFAETGSRAGDRIMQMEQALVFDERVLAMFEFEGEARNFFEMLAQKGANGDGLYTGLHAESYRKVDSLLKGMSDQHVPLPEKTWSKREAAIVSIATSAAWTLRYRIHANDDSMRYQKRAILIGLSDMADGWTNGCSFICISRQYLSRMKSTPEDFVKLGLFLLHENLHDEADSGSHIHTPEFYQLFHDWSDLGAEVGFDMFRSYHTKMRRAEKKGVIFEPAEGQVSASPEAQAPVTA